LRLTPRHFKKNHPFYATDSFRAPFNKGASCIIPKCRAADNTAAAVTRICFQNFSNMVMIRPFRQLQATEPDMFPASKKDALQKRP